MTDLVLVAIFFYYFMASFFVWLTLFHVHMVARLYLIRLPRYIMWVYFFLAHGTWSLIIVIVGLAIDDVRYGPGTSAYV